MIHSVGTLLQILELKSSACKTEEDRGKALQEILAAADSVVSAANEPEVLAFGSLKAPAVPSKEYNKKKKDVGDRKKALVQAYYRKCEALLVTLRNESTFSKELCSHFEVCFEKFRSITETDLRFMYLVVARETLHDRYGNALKAVNKYLADNAQSAPSSSASASGQGPFSSFLPEHLTSVSPDVKKLFVLRTDLLLKLGWTQWKDHESQWNLIRFPGEYAAF